MGRCPGIGNGNPLQHSCLGNPMDRGAWRATVHGVTKNQTRLSYFTYLLTYLSWICLLGSYPMWHSGKESACQCRRYKRCGFNPWVRKIPWRRKRQPSSVLLPGKSHGQKSLAGYSPWGHRVRHNLATKQQQTHLGGLHPHDLITSQSPSI